MEEFRFLSDSEIDAIINEYRGKIPSFLLDQIKEKVKSKPITEEQLRKILDETAKEYKKESKPIEELNEIKGLVSELHRIIKEFKEKKKTKETVEEKKVEEEKKEEEKIPVLKEEEVKEPMILEKRKYRLEKIPDDATSIIIAMKWLDFLLERVGLNNLSDVLEYYIDLGWISEDVHMQLMKLARGIKLIKEPDWKPTERLTLEDHIISLLFIERLRGGRIPRDFLDKLYQEINFIKKTVEKFYGV